jgi:hypothetical protein
MYRMSITSTLVFVSVVVSVVRAAPPSDKDKAVTIPLDQIWAYKMPGTRDIQELDKARPKGSGRGFVALISESSVLRAEDLKWEKLARPGFAVAGTGLSALAAAHDVFVANAKPHEIFSQDEEITIVFFSEPVSGDRVHVRNVERRGHNIEVQYRLEPYFEKHLSSGLALIPIGKLPVGEYHVELHQLPREKKYVERGFKPLNEEWSRKFLCKPFSFSVTEKAQ